MIHISHTTLRSALTEVAVAIVGVVASVSMTSAKNFNADTTLGLRYCKKQD
jgi:hypothetical protein